MEITSPSFENNGIIPNRYTKKGENIPPPLNFKDIPPETKSLAITVTDKTGSLIVVTHWVIWNIPPEVEKLLPADIGKYPHGRNSFRQKRYLGPCPPYGIHKYFFKLYALDSLLELKAGISRKKLEKEMQGKIIAESQLVGIYKK